MVSAKTLMESEKALAAERDVYEEEFDSYVEDFLERYRERMERLKRFAVREDPDDVLRDIYWYVKGLFGEVNGDDAFLALMTNYGVACVPVSYTHLTLPTN